MSELNQDNTILSHLKEYIQGLERQLNYPKNDWKRQENLAQQLSEAKQRVQSIEKRSTRSSRGQSRSSGRAGSDRRLSTTGDRTRNTKVIRTKSDGQRPTGGHRESVSKMAVEYR